MKSFQGKIVPSMVKSRGLLDLAGKVLRDSRSLDKTWSLVIGSLAGMSLKLLRNDFFFQLGKFSDLKIIS